MESFTLRANSLSDCIRQVANRVTIDEELRRARHMVGCMDLAFNAVLRAGAAHIRAQDEAERINTQAQAAEGDEGLTGDGIGA